MKLIFKNKYTPQKDVVLVTIKQQAKDVFLTETNGRKELVLGLKNKKTIDHRKFFLLVRKIIQLSKNNGAKKIALKFFDFTFPKINLTQKEIAETLITNLQMANYQFNRYKKKPANGWEEIQELNIIGKINTDIKQAFKKGIIIAEKVNHCRDLVNTPGSDMTPKILLQTIRKAIKKTKIKLSVLDERTMRKIGMKAVLSVGQGSREPSQFIILKYWGAKNRQSKPVVLVGKAVTYDSGGINLKPAEAMKDMHMDMAGGAAVLETVLLAEKLKLKKNIIVLIPAVENMPGGKSYRLGDIIKTLSGKTIEVGHTDAEGRIILADALTYAKKYQPQLVIDVATLTGASLVALGQRATAIYTSHEKYHSLLKELGEKSGDYVWPMPLWEEFENEIKGTFGDVSNTGKYRWGGCNTAAAFLYQFAKKYPWIHFDIAPTMTAIDDQRLEKGATGVPVRLLIKFIENN